MAAKRIKNGIRKIPRNRIEFVRHLGAKPAFNPFKSWIFFAISLFYFAIKPSVPTDWESIPCRSMVKTRLKLGRA
ncbi:hypothetical protein [Luteolibacter soli]|uniref:hypothetical protein n=1 Tax=Luteolibacter soli TaxID=3135280 RepID=UPI0031197578